MGLVAILLITVLLWNNIVASKSHVSVLGIISSLKDMRELLIAYKNHDYVLMTVKLIDIKIKAIPPKQESLEECELLLVKYMLEMFHPHYLEWIKTQKLKDEAWAQISNEYSSKHAKSILAAINILDEVIEQVNATSEYVINVLTDTKSQLEDLLEDTKEENEVKANNGENDNKTAKFHNDASKNIAYKAISSTNTKPNTGNNSENATKKAENSNSSTLMPVSESTTYDNWIIVLNKCVRLLANKNSTNYETKNSNSSKGGREENLTSTTEDPRENQKLNSKDLKGLHQHTSKPTTNQTFNKNKSTLNTTPPVKNENKSKIIKSKNAKT